VTDSEHRLPGTLSPEALATLHEALRRHVRSPMPDGDLRRALRVVCEAAHTGNARPETVIIALKDVFHSMPEVRQLEREKGARASDDMVSHLVTLCIQEFYGGE
jgi:hypothetical protein